ncbi:Repeat domain-containing protein [Fodinibius roseus]|uniref:Repeat domain-containing protein n=1 Tax=Fodinibius roseus TaxID=1194090 RepID=A0A1M5C068_9BACT|nr:FG-GAP-like repeat-containing protein [Fodinibius roseus]SHF48138.1 Repeat domain-containing protein [Fodinibius roseus]
MIAAKTLVNNTGIFWIIALLFTGCTTSEDLEWHREEGYRWAELTPGFFGSTGFQKLDSTDTGIRFRNSVSRERIEENRNFLNGSGVSTADVDGDGWVDIYLARLEGPNKLYRNRGNFEFEDITEKANLAHEGYHSTGVVFADVNGDSHPDLLVTSLAKRNELYLNDGEGHFTLKEDSGLGPSEGSNTMALADIDNDGDLDLYITNYKLRTVRDIYPAEELSTENTVRREGDSLVVIPPFDKYYGIIETEGQSYRNEYGAKDELYINQGGSSFRKAVNDKDYFLAADGSQEGLSRDWGLTAKFQDVNGDGYSDLYVANDFWTPDRMWMNQGNGTFRSVDRNAIRNMSFSAMGVDFSDINRDGAVDIFVSEMLSSSHQRRLRQLSEHLDPIEGRPQYNRNSLYLNRGDLTFAEISSYSNVTATEWSWATNFLDIDLDGYEDLIITTGYAYDYQDIDTQIQLNSRSGSPGSMQRRNDIITYPRLALPNQMLRNNRDLTFSDKSVDWGFSEDDISLGLALADLDNDGDADFVINRFNQAALVYRNETNAPRIAVQLSGEAPNTGGIGAKVTLTGASVDQQKEMSAGGSYVSGPQPMLFFAAESGDKLHGLTVQWPDGSTTHIDSVKANRVYDIEQSLSRANVKSPSKEKETESATSLFQEVSDEIGYIHHEDPYTDVNVQPLLPVLLSRQGPGIAWIDYEGDGDDDLFIASGKGGRTGIFENTGEGEFEPLVPDGPRSTAPGDQTTILGWHTRKGLHLITGSANFEQGDPRVPSALSYIVNGGNAPDMVQKIPGILSTTGPLAASDYDGDGDVDLFVGGRFKPGEYPRDASSRLFRNEKGRFVPDRVNSKKLDETGLVSGAVFTDYDGDGDQDLLLSRAWDSILLLENQNGLFVDISSEAGLQKFKGWWNGVATGDFNNDGRPDIVAGNIGSNSVYQPDEEYPLKLYYSDFDMDGTLDIIDSYYNTTLQAYVPRRKLYDFDSMPSVLGRINSHKQFARSSVGEITGQDVATIPSREINTVEQMLFINTKEGFEAAPLPVTAQFSAAFHTGIADFNSDGNEDLFLSQNNFAFPDNIPRLDAGRGLLLLGDGDGSFEVVRGRESGIMIYGQQRGAAVSDFNGDGRPDLAVTQNEGPVKLYRNRGSKPGIRIRLAGPPENRDAIGSGMRVRYEDGSRGPLREVQAGTGYWSQHSTTPVMGAAGKAVALEIYWFDGETDTVDISSGAGSEKEYIIRY